MLCKRICCYLIELLMDRFCKATRHYLKCFGSLPGVLKSKHQARLA
jgi:hypothetical protein